MLRPVQTDDFAIFFDQQTDTVALEMAAVPTRDRAAHDAQWTRVLADPSIVIRTVVDRAVVVGNVVSFVLDGERNVGYWIGRSYWGRGLATRALAEYLDLVTERPLYAHVADSNLASVRVLAKCGFDVVGSHRDDRDGVVEIVLRLDA